MQRILLLDDDAPTVHWMYHALSTEGYDVYSAVDVRTALAIALDTPPDVLITDWLLRDSVDGVEVARQLALSCPQMKIVMITGLSTDQLVELLEDQKLSIECVLEKPVEPRRLLDTIRKALLGKLHRGHSSG